MPHTVTLNRAPVLTLWAAVVAERLALDAGAAPRVSTAGSQQAGSSSYTVGMTWAAKRGRVAGDFVDG